MTVVLDGASSEEILRSAQMLRTGGLVAFPTETVYGLGADASSEQAVSRIFVAKGRPADHPLIVHLGRVAELDRWAQHLPPVAWRLAERFWPGPLTLILNRAPGVSNALTGGQDTIGLRMPNHPVALALLEAFGGGIAAPSANRFGRISPTTAAHVMAELSGAIDGVIDGGPCTVGLESTILDLSESRPRVLRPGAITADALAEVIGERPAREGTGGPRVPGRLPAHYAPATPLRLLDAASIEPAVQELQDAGRATTVLALQPQTSQRSHCRWRIMPADPEQYACLLYARLREADTPDCDCILVQRPPATLAWEAVCDRLERAAAGAGR